MVGTLEHGVLRFLSALGSHARAGDQTQLACAGGRTRRTLQRWLRTVGDTVTFYPNVRYHALGLEHVHAFIDNPQTEHLAFPYAADAAWVTSGPGTRTLYLHCLVPTIHVEHAITTLRRTAPHVTTITTTDGFQDNDLASISPDGIPQERRPTARLELPRPAPPVLITGAYPLILPVATALLGQRQTMHELWTQLYGRLGERVWTFLPARTRRWRRNGKAYVHRALALLNEYGLVSQHIVRVRAVHTIEVFFITKAVEDVEAVRAHAPLLELFPGHDRVLVRAQGTLALLKALLHSPAVSAWWLAQEERAPPVRVSIERLFDPTTNTWRQCAKATRAS